jgi:uncharacterized protein (TIGR02996 family)
MHADADFLRKLLEDPADDTARLVYADWLDERADPESRAKAEFLRVACERGRVPADAKRQAERLDAKLRTLAAGLDPDWLAVVSEPAVENCRAALYEQVMADRFKERFRYVCPKKWEGLTPTERTGERFCDACRKPVYFCGTIREAREHAVAGHCIAVDLGIPRKPNDLRPPPATGWLGRPEPEFYRRYIDTALVDPVSAAREARKRDEQKPAE